MVEVENDVCRSVWLSLARRIVPFIRISFQPALSFSSKQGRPVWHTSLPLGYMGENAHCSPLFSNFSKCGRVVVDARGQVCLRHCSKMGIDQGTIFLKHASPRVVGHVHASKSLAAERRKRAATTRSSQKLVWTSVSCFEVTEDAQIEVLD
jgi:hypothetical protein